ncbi:alpha/beta hydrolase [Spirosoma sp. SC4-14]|uniref:alpha/beta fold hydrolase n=1 Tax=Spirosoma sp. SC4-14 TaxID=3128900 RepID=UPI0030D2D58B
MAVEFFEFAKSRIAFRRFGNGPSILLVFHGFGQTGEVFSTLDQPLGQHYTVLAIDLFFHGSSHYKGTSLLTKHDWQKLLEAFCKSENIDRFSLMGFSLGGRFALAASEQFADRLDALILIAPDGITRSFWYEVATGTAAGRWLFRFFLDHLSMLNALGHTLTRLGLLNRTVMRFAEISLGTADQRARVYQSWTQFRLIRPDLNQISQQLNRHAVTIEFFTGVFDRIVPAYFILPLTRLIYHYKITTLRTGHNRLIELAGEQLSNEL